jgi:sugar lactone lactonase YvrE
VKAVIFLIFFLPICAKAQLIITVAGTGVAGSGGDGGPATAAQLYNPNSLVFDKVGNMYITDVANNKIRKVDASGVITTIAGNGSGIYSGDGGQATAAGLATPASIAIDSESNLYTGTVGDYRIRKIGKDGIITTIAGNGSVGFNGDNIPATSAQLYGPYMGFVDNKGDVYFTDRGSNRVRKINTTGIITTIAGNGTNSYSGDNGPATAATLKDPIWPSISPSGDIFIPENYGYRIRRIDPLGVITTFAGTGIVGNDGDGGPATNARFTLPNGVAFDDTGNVYVADFQGGVVRKINAGGIITRLAGNGVAGYGGDGGPATLAQITPNTIALDKKGNVYIADYGNNRIRKLIYGKLSTADLSEINTEVSVLPNPATRELTIKASFFIKEIKIVDAVGQIVYYKGCYASELSISIYDLPCGMYYLNVNDSQVIRFIKK